MDEYLSKPFNAAGLRRAMAAVLPAATLKRAALPKEQGSQDRAAVLEALRGMEDDGVDVQLVVSLFCEEAAQALARVEDALEVGASEEVWRAAHKLKGTAAELGAEVLRDHWGKLEQCARAGDLEQSKRLFQAARAELEQISKVVETASVNPAPLTY
jgi:HPt (histidine-containing phosphotransfer) domain-containing protein